MINAEESKKIKIKLLKMNLSQTNFAKILNRSRQQINNVINGKVENLKLEEDILTFVGIYKK